MCKVQRAATGIKEVHNRDTVFVICTEVFIPIITLEASVKLIHKSLKITFYFTDMTG